MKIVFNHITIAWICIRNKDIVFESLRRKAEVEYGSTFAGILDYLIHLCLMVCYTPRKWMA